MKDRIQVRGEAKQFDLLEKDTQVPICFEILGLHDFFQEINSKVLPYTLLLQSLAVLESYILTLRLYD